jgi:hypothetical protein
LREHKMLCLRLLFVRTICRPLISDNLRVAMYATVAASSDGIALMKPKASTVNATKLCDLEYL